MPRPASPVLVLLPLLCTPLAAQDPAEDPAGSEASQEGERRNDGRRAQERVEEIEQAIAEGQGEGTGLTGEPSAPRGDEEQVFELGIEDAVRMALGNSVQIELTEVDTEIREFDAIGSWGAFEWVFDANVNASRETQQGTNQFDGGRGTEIRNDRLDMDVSFRRPVTTGGTFQIAYNRILTDTDNPIFADRDPVTGELLPFDAIDFTRDTLSVSYVQPFLRGAWSDAVTAVQREAELARNQQLEAERATRQQLEVDVRTRYWDLVAAQRQRAVAEASLELGRRQLERERTKLEAGVGTEVEVIQAEAEVATRRETLIQRETAVGQAEDDLRVLLFSPENLQDNTVWMLPIETRTPLPEPEGDLERFDPSQVPGYLAVALENRSQLRQQDYAVEIARVRHQAALADRRSQLDLTLAASSLGFNENDVVAREDALGFEFPTYSAVLNFSMPLGNKTRGYAEKVARAQIRRAQLEYSQLETQVASDVRRALRNLTFRAEAVVAARQSLLFAQRQLEAEEAKYEEGLSTLFQVFEFQQTLVEAVSSLATARVEYAKALVELENAQGLVGEARP